MLTTLTGVYENGQIVLSEDAPLIHKSKVLITFMEELESVNKVQKRTLGLLNGIYILPDNFNDDLDDLKDYM